MRPAGAASGSGPSTATSKRRISSRSTRSPTPPPWRPSLDKVAELIKAGRAKEIADMRDETDLSGLKLAIDLKRGVDPDKLMTKLYKLTPLEDAFACNFNVLIAGTPKVLGVRQILEEWTAWRTGSVRRRVYFVMKKKQDKLHLLKGLKRILLDIDKAIQIIRETEEGGRGHPQPDDRLRHRPDPGGVRGGDQAPQHQQGVYPQACQRDRRPPGRDRRPGGHPELPGG